MKKKYGVCHSDDTPLDARLRSIVLAAFEKTGHRVVLLIDEYDAPMLNSVDDEEIFTANRKVLSNLFSPIKDLDPYLIFVFITGISKFSQMSIFSVLNNLVDISLDSEYEGICGFTKEELRKDLREHVKVFADYNNIDIETAYQKLKEYYDGYHFSEEMRSDIFNPFSMVKCLSSKKLGTIWFESASPSALIKLVNKFDFEYDKYNKMRAVSSRFYKPIEKVDDPVPLLFQSGYLSIKDYDDGLYTLCYPNAEVSEAFANVIINYKSQDAELVSNLIVAFKDFKKDDNFDKFARHLKVFFAGYPYSLNNKNETHYHSTLYTALVAFGADVSANPETSLGKADLLLKMPKSIYVIELNYNRSKDAALYQIDNREYTQAYLDDGKRIFKVGINFDEATRNIKDYEVVEVK